MSAFEFNSRSLVDLGTAISPNFILDHLTQGAWHPIFARYLPIYTQPIDPQILNNIPLWKLARNLSISSNNILENIFKEFGSSLMLRQGFNLNFAETLTREVGHRAGLSLDIGIVGAENNLYYLANDIRRLAMKASRVNLIYDQTSWIHLDIDPLRASSNATREELPPITSQDLTNGVVEEGVQSYRGFY